jgi:hypothetical protein
VFNLQGLLGTARPTTSSSATTRRRHVAGRAPAGFENIILNLSGSVANTGIAGQGATSGLAIPADWCASTAPATAGRLRTIHIRMTIADSLSRVIGNHFLKVGGDARLIRMSTDSRVGSLTASRTSGAFLANTPTTIQYFGDLSEPSPFHNGGDRMKHIEQEYQRRVRAGRVARVAEADDELRPAIRLLRAVERNATTGSSSSTSTRALSIPTRRRSTSRRRTISSLASP